METHQKVEIKPSPSFKRLFSDFRDKFTFMDDTAFGKMLISYCKDTLNFTRKDFDKNLDFFYRD